MGTSPSLASCDQKVDGVNMVFSSCELVETSNVKGYRELALPSLVCLRLFGGLPIRL